LVVAAPVAIVSGCTGSGTGSGPAAESHPTQLLFIKGTLSYRTRIARPPESRASVELRDTSVADGRVIAEQRIDLQGRQVPIPFELAVNRAQFTEGKQYSVRDAVLVGARATWVSEPVVVAPKQQTLDLGMLMMAPFTAQAFTSALQCGDQKVTVGVVDVMRLTVGDRSFDSVPWRGHPVESTRLQAIRRRRFRRKAIAPRSWWRTALIPNARERVGGPPASARAETNRVGDSPSPKRR
jgi:uncharacterized lipoprotein YbaY